MVPTLPLCDKIPVILVPCLPLLTAVSQLSDEDKQLLLDLHNRARSMVDPIATNMEEMVTYLQEMQHGFCTVLSRPFHLILYKHTQSCIPSTYKLLAFISGLGKHAHYDYKIIQPFQYFSRNNSLD